MQELAKKALIIVVGIGATAGIVFWQIQGIRAETTWLAEVDADSSSAALSNILPEDYIGSEKCKECHENQFERWRTHSHGRMNQTASAQSVRGDFSGTTMSSPLGEVRFTHEGGQYLMTLTGLTGSKLKYLVTRTIGSRFMQMYVGKLLEGPAPAGHPAYSIEHRLPFGYWFKMKRWLPHNYLDPLGPEHDANGRLYVDSFNAPDLIQWRPNCMVCHNTWPYVYRLPINGARAGFTREDSPESSAAVWTAIGRSINLKGLAYGDQRFLGRVNPDQNLVELGVGCEACHFGGRAHIADQQADMPLLPRGAMLASAVSGDAHAQKRFAVTGTCLQCHSAEGTTFANGAGVGNSREALDLQAGKCSSQITCLSCHDPHQTSGQPEGIPGNPKSVAACVGCHSKYAKVEVAKQHSGHPTTQVTCLDCHMPRIAQGLDDVVRSHTISSPSDPRMLAAGAPNACNMCHGDKSVRWTVDTLRATWSTPITLDPKWEAAWPGGFDAAAADAWLKSKWPANRVAGAQAWSKAEPTTKALSKLIAALDDDVPINRILAGFAIGRVRGRPVEIGEFDPVADASARRTQIEQLLKAHRSNP